MRADGRRYYARNTEKVKAVNVRIRKLRRAEAHTVLADIKNKPCTDCGKTYIKEVMEFDHISNDKLYEVSDVARNGNMARMLEEIAKCELVCANCHRIRTFNRRTLCILPEEPRSLP
jgi:hypothetical protein